MPRTARIVIPGLWHHITHRGNRRHDVFLREEDLAIYLALFAEHAARLSVACSGYCLMTNHVHLVAKPAEATSLARVIGSAHLRYTLLLNARENCQGHRWQHRFFSAPLDECYRWRALRYVELHPVRAGMVTCPEAYPWSSAAVHRGVRSSPDWLDMTEWAACWTPDTWRDYLGSNDEAQTDCSLIRARALIGRPLGSEKFVQYLEELTGRRLQFGPVGRPK